MAGGSTSNKARGKELGSKLHTTGGARSSRPFVSGGLLCMMGLWSSRNQATRMILACPQRGLRTTGRNLASYKRSGFGGVCGRRCGEFSFGSPSNCTFESISGPSRRTPRTTTTTTTPQRPQRSRRLSWSPSHSSAAHHASLCTARLRAAAASELTPPKAEARARWCGGVELPSRATRPPRTTRTRELHLANNGTISACVRSSRAQCGTARAHVAKWAVGRSDRRAGGKPSAEYARRRVALSACSSRYSTAMRARRHQTRTP